MEPGEVFTAEEFHGKRPFYDGPVGWSVFKRADRMALVAYEPSHPNPRETGDRAGRGRSVSRWVFCERESDGEGLFSIPLRLMIDSQFEPNASVGLHAHLDNEEIYYLLEGRLTVTTVAADGRESTAELRPGDAHACRLGQSHSCFAGPQGARVLSISIDVRRSSVASR